MHFVIGFILKVIKKLGHPRQLYYVFLCLPRYLINLVRYRKTQSSVSFPITFDDLRYETSDSKSPAGHVDSHYFLQDIWAARKVLLFRPDTHVDIGSRLDGFVSHLLGANQKVRYLDWRDPLIRDACFQFQQADIMRLPFSEASVNSLSCLHVLEHIGLGRYGDPVEAGGYEKAAKELMRVLAPGGILLLSVPIGEERLCFDAHRVFSPKTVVTLFEELLFKEFRFIDPEKHELQDNADMDYFADKKYFCGLFVFQKKIRN